MKSNVVSRLSSGPSPTRPVKAYERDRLPPNEKIFCLVSMIIVPPSSCCLPSAAMRKPSFVKVLKIAVATGGSVNPRTRDELRCDAARRAGRPLVFSNALPGPGTRDVLVPRRQVPERSHPSSFYGLSRNYLNATAAGCEPQRTVRRIPLATLSSPRLAEASATLLIAPQGHHGVVARRAGALKFAA
jgi:hypothetical protein